MSRCEGAPRGHRDAARIVAAVRDCIGTPFRSQGRVPGVGLDCVGVALVAAHAARVPVGTLPRYQLGGDHEQLLDSIAASCGLARCEMPSPGDIWVFAPAAGRRHVAVQVGEAGAVGAVHRLFVHAHAGLGKVVESPADPAWMLINHWRLPEGI